MNDDTSATEDLTQERQDLLEALGQARYFLRLTVRGLSDAQAAQRTTVSALSLGGLIKHVSAGEHSWSQFMVDGPDAPRGQADPAAADRHLADMRFQPTESLQALLADYQQVAENTDDLIRTLPNLDDTRPLPPAPWFAEGAVWSHRRTLLHILAEIRQHSGHADIIREALDGATSMT